MRSVKSRPAMVVLSHVAVPEIGLPETYPSVTSINRSRLIPTTSPLSLEALKVANSGPGPRQHGPTTGYIKNPPQPVDRKAGMGTIDGMPPPKPSDVRSVKSMVPAAAAFTLSSNVRDR